MRKQVIESTLVALRQQFPYTPPGDLYPHGASHEFLWNIAIREGRQQVIRWLEEQVGGGAPIPEDSDVLSPEDRSSPAADACARSRPGS